MKKNISITLDKGLINRLREFAKREGKSLSSVLRLASREHVVRFIKPPSFSQESKAEQSNRIL